MTEIHSHVKRQGPLEVGGRLLTGQSTHPVTPITAQEKDSLREHGVTFEGVGYAYRPDNSRRCSRCFLWFPIEAFRPNPKLAMGRSSWCHGCALKRTRQWREANPEYFARYNAARREGPFGLDCVDCEQPFLGARRHMVRCPACQAEMRRVRNRVARED